VVEKLGMVMVRILPDENPSGDWLKLVAPSGKAGGGHKGRLQGAG